MKRLILILVAAVGLIGAALVAPVLLEDPGYVRIDIGRWRIEMSMLALAGGVLVVWIALSLLTGFLRLPGRVLRRARESRSRRQLERGFLALTEGDWRRADRELKRSLRHRGSTAGYLAAARAAQGRGDARERDRMLQLADARFGRRHFVTGLARARLLLGEGRIEEAIPVLEELHLRKRKHTGVLRLLLESYQDLGRWRDLRLLTPALRRAGVVDEERAEELAAMAAERELEASPEIDALEYSWKELGRKFKQRRELILAFARRAGELGRPGLAGRALTTGLQQSLDSELLKAYADAPADARAGRIERCEKWLADHPDHAGLQLALGLLYFDDRQYEKARELLERVISQQPSAQAYTVLGRVLDRAGELEAAARCYRNALRYSRGRGADPLPPPVADDDIADSQ